MTVDIQVAAVADDACETLSSGMDLTNTLIIDAETSWQGLRWAVPGRLLGLGGAVIDTAWIDMYFAFPTQDEPDHRIDFELGASPPAFTTDANNISGRTGTTASAMLSHTNLITGSEGAWLSALQTMPFPEIKTILQELVDAYGNAITHMAARIRGSASATRDFAITQYGSGFAGGPAILHIEFTPGPRKWFFG